MVQKICLRWYSNDGEDVRRDFLLLKGERSLSAEEDLNDNDARRGITELPGGLRAGKRKRITAERKWLAEVVTINLSLESKKTGFGCEAMYPLMSYVNLSVCVCALRLWACKELCGFFLLVGATAAVVGNYTIAAPRPTAVLSNWRNGGVVSVGTVEMGSTCL